MNMFLDERKLKEFVASRPTLKQCLQEVLQMEVNDKRRNTAALGRKKKWDEHKYEYIQ